MAASTYGFGAENISFVKTDVKAGSGSITLGNTFLPGNIGKSLGTSLAQGSFLVDDGLVAFDSSPIFIADSGQLARDFNVNQNAEKQNKTEEKESSVTSRPYVWKYQ